jgi:hypothetical protein
VVTSASTLTPGKQIFKGYIMQYLVTTDINRLPQSPVAMIDGTVPGYSLRNEDIHYDHHRAGGAEIQIDETPVGRAAYIEYQTDEEIKFMFVTTQLDADACVAAAWLQLIDVSEEDERKLRAIAFDCDHLKVPDDLADLADFAAQAVAAMKSEGFKIAGQLGLPEDRRVWTDDQKVAYASEGFRQGTEWLIAAVKGERKYPGEMGEAAEYWEQVQKDEQQFINEGRITKYKDALIFDMMGWGGCYVDPRASLRAAKRLGMSATLTLTQRETKEGGWSYTLASSAKNLLTGFNAFQELTEAEATKRNVDISLVHRFWGKPELSGEIGFDPWGGREAVGGSGWRTPSLLHPKEVIDILM